jgi:branched-chain amino acid transport system substrate-binding protein
MGSRAGLLVLAAAAALALTTLAGCGPGGAGGLQGDTLTVYFALPLRGESGPAGRAIRDGAKLALADADGRAGELRLKPVFLDDTRGARWSPVAAGDDARRAAQDTTAIAYVGDLESGATRTSLPITNEARMLQVSPGSTAIDLARNGPGAGDEVPELVQPTGERTFGRVIPDDETQAEAAGVWARKLGSRRAAVVTDGSEFGAIVAGEFAEQAEGEGVAIEADERRRLPGAAVRDVARARPDLVYYGGTADDALPLLARVADAAPGATIMGTDALLEPDFLRAAGRLGSRLRITSSAEDPRQLPAEGQRFRRAYRGRFGHAANPYAAYGYEAMAVTIDAVDRAGDQAEDRGAVIDAFFDTRDRRSVLGTYSIDEVGNTTLKAIAGYRVSAGRPVFDTALHAP